MSAPPFMYEAFSERENHSPQIVCDVDLCLSEVEVRCYVTKLEVHTYLRIDSIALCDLNNAMGQVEELERTLKFQKELSYKPHFGTWRVTPSRIARDAGKSKKIAVHLVRAIVQGFGVQITPQSIVSSAAPIPAGQAPEAKK